ncbi:hypothetical protein [Bergeriella denitrificans]|uniref:Uncharacterized protein n=1 Tax=Bergeriella denitrificans TaxID=494 RepID=A0A378UIJ5_BERDE|nr:hypothetical protein [Bergeriella denitrificans]STZ76311.1 Uncharacterised protein [Bergeriella denitrificans]
MKISKPNEKDLAAAWAFIRNLNLVSYGMNPLKPIGDDGDYETLEDEDRGEVLDALIEAYDNCDIQWLMTVLETLLSPENKIIDQEADTLELSPELKAALASHSEDET